METENELIRQRREKVEALRDRGIHPYPDAAVFEVDTTTGEFRQKYGDLEAEELEKIDDTHRMAGRALRIRGRGKLNFVVLQDRHGQLQAFLSKKEVPEDQWAIFKELVQEGDYIAVVGTPMRTKTGELSIKPSEVYFLSKGVRQLPEKYHGLKDKETRYRRRYVDLMTNPEVAEVFKQRSKIIAYIRRFFDSHDFLEVETPMMHPIAGGATARPFTTHHNALDMELFLRIAPELYLKRLVVGGLERVYEINRNFRNEGLSLQHNPEFTMLEFYCAYWTYHRLMDFTEELMSGLVEDVCGSSKITYHPNPNDRDGEKPVEEWDAVELDFSSGWKRATMWELVSEHVKPEAFESVHAAFESAWEASPTEEQSARVDLERRLTVHLTDDERAQLEPVLKPVIEAEDPKKDSLLELAKAMDEALSAERIKFILGDVLYAVFEEKIEPTLIQPQFVTRFPLAVSPLARKCDDDPSLTDRFELFIAGREIANAFSELNDPADQKERFLAQASAKAAGDDEAMSFDDDYVRALEYGMPPTAGEGIGIDRLVMLLTDQASIRDVILFPLLRKETQG